ncbi:MAG: Crp/Fnr family transcriptional regulator [Elusimicrobia bacterium]|nr:Crp/Fnr family transcriptional regulator [Elusimicrobiota bacterium]
MGYDRTAAPKFVCPQPASAGCAACTCEKRCFLGLLDPDQRRRFRAERIHRLYRSRQIIFSPGDAPQGLMILCRGSVRIAFTTEQGRQVTVGYASCGELLGEAAYVAGKPHAFTAEALGDSFVSFLPKALSDELLAESPKLARRVAEDSCGRYCATAKLASNWILKSADAKLAEFLLSDEAGAVPDMPCKPHQRLSRKSLSEHVGLAPETVIRRLSDFKRRGLVRFAGKAVEIVDRGALAAVASDHGQAAASAIWT